MIMIMICKFVYKIFNQHSHHTVIASENCALLRSSPATLLPTRAPRPTSDVVPQGTGAGATEAAKKVGGGSGGWYSVCKCGRRGGYGSVSGVLQLIPWLLRARTSDASDGRSLYCSASPVLLLATVLSNLSISATLPPSHRRVRRSIQRLLYVTAMLVCATAAAAGWPVCL